MKKIVVFTFLCFHCLIFAQGDYFEHTVSKGETLYQLSRKYNVRIAQIYNLNPSIEGDLIKIDQVLLIPKSDRNFSAVSQQQDEEFIYHIVEPKETKFGLQRKYGIQISQLEADNPHIVAMLQAGHRVRIRKSLAKNTTNQAFTSPSSSNNVHIVVQGETLTAIARQYSVSIHELVAINKDNLGEFLQIGQHLVIPGQQRLAQSSNPVHVVQRGETKYGLSKKYNTSIGELERLNPQIVTMLKAGHILVLPTSSEARRLEEVVVDTPKQEIINNHISIAEEAYIPAEDDEEEVMMDQNVSVEEEVAQEETPEPETTEKIFIEDVTVEDLINEANENADVEEKAVVRSRQSAEGYIDYEIQPKETLYGLSKKANLTQDQLIALNPSLQEGVRIGMIIKMPSHVEQSVRDVASSTITTPQVWDSSLTDLTKTMVKDNSKKLLFTLPMETLDYERYKSTKQVGINREEIEFYSGALIAIDSIQKLGVNVEVELMDIRNTALNNISVTAINPDAIIGTSTQKEELNVSIPFIYPFAKNFNIDTHLFRVIPSKNSRVKVMLNYLAAKNGNVILIGDAEKTVNRDLVAENLPNSKFLAVNDRVNPDADSFKNLLDKKNKNYIILDTESTSLFLNATNMLLNQMADFDIQLVIIEDTPVIKNQEISVMRLRILKTLYTSLYDEQENKNSLFYRKYFSLNKILPTENAVRGFDVTFDVLLRLTQNTSFEDSIESHKTKHNRQQFDYQKLEEGKYQNKAVYILYYDTDSDIKKAE